ncbi:AAA family ATPase [Flavisolibacter sp. BT320]|nr:AAA family ATPase [Flavisolibacter longurius]
MKIKDIRQFRAVYKNEIREIDSSNRNEHFVGVRTEVNGKSQYGFFEIYHGDKEGFNESDGIRGFLEGFLDMAKDGQAVYEFMQNAVDAKSTRFCLFWGRDEEDENTYLLVMNDGDMFNMDSVRSILNVGVSTKSANSFTIGKFGIGFKLAHRLVGKENGLDELIHQNYGPILFSWQNNEIEQFENLIEQPNVIPTEQEYEVFSEKGKRKAIIKTTEPWLFKILITNFPCQPENDVVEERIYNNQFEETTSAFSKAEVRMMAKWIKKHKAYLQDDFHKGSLFFIRLGQGKQSHLEEENLEEGVKFSLAILNKIAKKSLGHEGLHKLNLNGSEINPVNLQFEPFVVNKTEDREQYRFLRFGKTEDLSDTELSKELADSDIEILLGYTDFNKAKEAFHNAPNFYLFFPLSEEKHRLRFILHSNAFYKSASRTFLQKGSVGEEGINERIFNVFVEKLRERMLGWSLSVDVSEKNKFVELYANLLLSDASDNPERVWINEPLYVPLLEVVKTNIPVKDVQTHSYYLVGSPDNVFIKSTVLPVDEYDWVADSLNWFFWDSGEAELSLAAEDKLKVKKFDIISLLQQKGIAEKLNAWLASTSYQSVANIFEELNAQNLSFVKDDVFRDNLGQLKIWQFEDGYFSLEEIGNEEEYSNRLILFDTLDSMKEQLTKAEWKLSFRSLTEFNNLISYVQNRFQSVIKYIRKNEELIRVLNLRFPAAALSSSDKLNIVKVLAKKLSDDKDDRISKIRELRLFRTKYGTVVPLRSLLKEANIGWLGSWVIRTEEYDTVLDDYFIQKPLDIYQNIVVAYWDEIVKRLSSQTEIKSLFDYARGVFKQNPGTVSLEDKYIIKIGEEFISADKPHYYTSTLAQLNESEYELFKVVASKLSLGSLPDYFLLEFYAMSPFRLQEKKLVFDSRMDLLNITADEVKCFLKIATKEDADFFSKYHLYESSEGEIMLELKPKNSFLAYSENVKVNNYIARYHPDLFRIFPSRLKDYAGTIGLQGDNLVKTLLQKCNFPEEQQFATLLEIVIESGIEARNFLAERFPKVTYNLHDQIVPESSSVRLIQVLLTLNDLAKAEEVIKKNVVIQWNDNKVILSEAHLMGQNDVVFEMQDKQFTLSLALILPNRDSKATEIVSKLVEQLVEHVGSDRHTLDNVFGLKGAVEKHYIYNQLKELYAAKALDNAHQLAFLIHHAKTAKNNELEGFTINVGNDVISLHDAKVYVFETECRYLPQSMILAEKYDGLKLLIPADKPFFKSGSNFYAYFKPYFEGNMFHLPGVDSLPDENRRLGLVTDLFNCWKADEEKYSSIELAEKKEWIHLLGFDPANTIVNPEWSLNSERVPPYLLTWLAESEHEVNSSKRYDFLRSLGVSLGGSDIVKIRKFLLGREQIYPGINYKIPETLIKNTLVFLRERNVRISINTQQVELVKVLFSRLPADFDIKSVPLPKIEKQSFSCLGFDFVQDGFYLNDAVYDQLNELNYPVNLLPDALGKPIVLSSILGGQNLLHKFLSPVQLQVGVLDVETIENHASELNRSYYNQWKLSFPEYKIFQFPGQLPYVIKFNEEIIFRYAENDIVSTSKGIIVNNETNDKNIIHLIENNNYWPANVISSLKALFDEYDDSIQDFLNRIQSSPKLKEEFEKLKEKEKIENKKQELAAGIGANAAYSMKWFMSLLELMVMSGGGNNLVNPQGDIVFSDIKYDPADLRVITLTDPSKVISPSIDLFTDFFASFTYLEDGIKKNKRIKISGVSKKGSELNVIATNHTELESINLSYIKEVELTFTRSLDLLKKLKNAFEALNVPEIFNFKDELSENIQFIFGPPGTGKTTEISRRVVEKIRTGEKKNILILTPTNKAADVLVNRILEISEDDDYPDAWLVRYGTSTDLDLLDRGLIYDGNTFKFHLYNKCVFVTTIQRFPYEKVITAEDSEEQTKTPIAEISWDTIIFDEASMIMLPAIVYPLFKRKYTDYSEDTLTEFIIGGDPLQIPPIYDISDEELGEDNEDIKEENIYSMVELQSFDSDIQAAIPKYGKNFGDKIFNLETQYRSIEPIGTIFSKFQYNNRLKHGRNENKGGSPQPRQLPDYFTNLGFKPITVIKYPINNDDAIYNPQKLNGSPFHLYSAFLVNELILKFRQETTNTWNVGVLSPYRPQANLLNRLLESHLDKSKLDILSDTVHGFQGGECDIVFAVFNPSSLMASRSRFFQKEYIINVAVSRARDYLILLIPDTDTEMRKLPLFYGSQPPGLMNIIQSLPYDCVATLKAEDLERKLMGINHYFQNNSFTNTHQSVNVYSDLFKEYIVRYNNSSLDVHLKPR